MTIKNISKVYHFNKYLYDEYKRCYKFDVFIVNKITGRKNKKKCNKFYFPKAINRVDHDLWKVKAKYIVKTKLLHLYFLF